MSSSEKEKYELKEQLRILRGDLSGDLENIGGQLNVVQRFQNSFEQNRKKWLLGGLIVGTLFAFSTSRRSFGRKQPRIGDGLMKNLFLGLLGMTSKQIIKQSAPALAKFLQREIGHAAAARVRTPQATEEPANNTTDTV